MDVHLTGLNGFGQKTDEVFAFWWDGKALKAALVDKLEPTDPWPAWEATVPAEELRGFAEQNPNIWQAKRDEHNAEMVTLLAGAVEVRVLIQEG